MLKEKAKHAEKPIREIIAAFKASKVSEKEVRKIIKDIIEKNKELVLEKKERAVNALMGDAMQKLKGKVEARVVAKILKEELGNVLAKIS